MRRNVARLGCAMLVLSLAGCGAVLVEPDPVLPKALVEPLPVALAVHYPAEFREYVHKEKRYGTDYEVKLGPAHVAELNRLFGAMFARVVEVEDPSRVPPLEPAVRLVVEPRFEDYAFLTPRDMAGDFFTVTIRYRLNVYAPGGERVDGYVFTGYGREKSGSLAGNAPLLVATQRAMREAGAKLAVELPQEETVRSLLAGRTVTLRRPGPPQPGEALGAFDGTGTVATPPSSGTQAAPQAAPVAEEPPAADPGAPEEPPP